MASTIGGGLLAFAQEMGTVQENIESETHGPPRSKGRVDFFRVAGTISEGRLRYSRRNSMPSSVRNLQQHPQALQRGAKCKWQMTATHIRVAGWSPAEEIAE